MVSQPKNCQRGHAAALAAFEAAGITPLEAATAHFKMEGEQEDLTEHESRAAYLWDEAQYAAAKACCIGWTTPPDRADFSLQR
jgi:hypothetical protein